MKIFQFIILFVLTFSFISCQNNVKPIQSEKEIVQPEKENLSKAYFASGCFWCTEPIFESVKGVKESISGYSGGHTKNPTYEQINTGKTGHAETVEVYYDSSIVSFKTLVDVYFASQNVTQINGQGPDMGSQYRSIIFYQNETEKAIIDEKIAILNKKIYPEKVAAEVKKFEKFWPGEDYHQDYEKLHPNQGYIKAISIPRLNKFKVNFPKEFLEEGEH